MTGLGHLCHVHEQFHTTEQEAVGGTGCSAEDRHCCLGRLPSLHPYGTLFLKPLCCSHFPCLTGQKHPCTVPLLLPAASTAALRAAQERAGVVPPVQGLSPVGIRKQG